MVGLAFSLLLELWFCKLPTFNLNLALIPSLSTKEHSCDPSCSFTTDGSRVFICAIRDLSIGERCSIDYSNQYYHCIMGRNRTFRKSYNFTCHCCLCIGPDIRRAFVCKNGHCKGIVCPNKCIELYGDGDECEILWTCLSCNKSEQSQQQIGIFD